MCCLTGTTLPLVLGVRQRFSRCRTDPCHTSRTAEYPHSVDRVCRISTSANRANNSGAPWFDKECTEKRALAIQAGHRAECAQDRQMQIKACQVYRAHKQRKRRQYYNNCVLRILDTYECDRSKLWKTIESLSIPRTPRQPPAILSSTPQLAWAPT